ncbi:bifunctional fucokinase/fucose pyrophosphorylase isoform X1 [Carex littledalei]|uniref:Bifunctional fucokinase/fucose pyrophosphorylase isoform X1 n=1 Tax=Carex littledalei TaxID=544730 RepID=A0A833VDD7_9POAL|nr:bifunctional fucokinase/fucose pyrophosphorylase isoform X1 [Carex littledalei]
MELTTPDHSRRRRRGQTAEETASILRNSWYHLRLSVRDPQRVATWDAIVLTAASPEQAALYEWQLARARRMGRISASTVAIAVPDPDGARIGSGAATLHALSTLYRHFLTKASDERGDGSSLREMVKFMCKKHVLLLHAGGDSKRVPWANPMGKVFLPLPYLAGDIPDAPVPLLFDHILAISSCSRQAFKNQGGILIMTGDVLPCFDASTLVLPDDSSCIITVPITLDIATNHGVIVARSDKVVNGEDYALSPVDNLLQKPTMKQLLDGHAILEDGTALLDTGIIAARGKAWEELMQLSLSSSQKMIEELIDTRKEMSLYEDLVAAWVPAKHEWLKQRPLGMQLITALGGQKMFSFCSYSLSFMHFGTSIEVLDHFSGTNRVLVGRRHLCLLPETTACDIASSAIILSSKISPGVSVGEDSVVYDSSISGRIQIGSQSIVVGVKISPDLHSNINSTGFVLPDRHCLWEVPLVNYKGTLLIYSGIHDNPKKSVKEGGIFCGKPWTSLLHDLKINETDLWSSQNQCLWNAKLFPMVTLREMLDIGMWLMGLLSDESGKMVNLWQNSSRVSLEELHRSIDYHKLCASSSNHQADLTAEIARACIGHGLLGRDFCQLCEEILQKDKAGVEICKELFSLFPNSLYSSVLPSSRRYQIQTDLLKACGDESSASQMEKKVWAAVARETSLAVKYGFEDDGMPLTSSTGTNISSSNGKECQNESAIYPKKAIVKLPVRVDFVGGWSDTPPWSLERAGCVLNMAIVLEGSLPVCAIIERTPKLGVLISDDSNNSIYINNPASITAPFDNDDQFRLVKSALVVTRIVNHRVLLKSGLKIETSARVPRGSGLGTSSILAAAVVRGLFEIMGEDACNERVARAVLMLEQIMGTGGGWQDQIGGLYPGIKCTSSFPGQPLQLQVIPLTVQPHLVEELEQRLLVVFTGQVRLAFQVLQKVVMRYLRRDSLLISSIKRLAELAKIGREALMNSDIDELGHIMREAWRIHQELDPFCSNSLVDRLFAFAEPYCCGYKLVGAGGGGFALLLAKDPENALLLRRGLKECTDFVVEVYNWSISM